MMPSEHQQLTATKLARIAWLSKRDPTKKIDCIMHHFNVESLTTCFNELDGKKAVGSDGVTKEMYGASLSKRLEDLVERMKRMAYRPGPVREVRIAKDGKPGATRPLGISNFEDKLVQKMMAKVLESIFDPTFYKHSYGFRPGLGCHDAIRALHTHLYKRPVATVIDVDLENFFGSIRSEVIEDCLRQRVGDERFIRYVKRMLKAGVLTDGELVLSEEGVPQGSPASPIISNIVAHCVIDSWFDTTVKAHCRGEVAMFRYADDLVICCELDSDAARIRKALGLRLEKYGLKLNTDKTRLVHFSATAKTQGSRQGSFDFLGFTFYLGYSRHGTVIPKVRTSRSRLRSKLRRVSDWARRMRSTMRLTELWPTFVAMIRGHINYYAISFNQVRVRVFIARATQIMFKWLNRRGGKRSMSWNQYHRFMRTYPLPSLRLRHTLFTIPQPV